MEQKIQNALTNISKDITNKALLDLLHSLIKIYDAWHLEIISQAPLSTEEEQLRGNISGIKNDLEINLSVVGFRSYSSGMKERLINYLLKLKSTPAIRPEDDYKKNQMIA